MWQLALHLLITMQALEGPFVVLEMLIGRVKRARVEKAVEEVRQLTMAAAADLYPSELDLSISEAHLSSLRTQTR